jgi:hypothetical protein
MLLLKEDGKYWMTGEIVVIGFKHKVNADGNQYIDQMIGDDAYDSPI